MGFCLDCRMEGGGLGGLEVGRRLELALDYGLGIGE